MEEFEREMDGVNLPFGRRSGYWVVIAHGERAIRSDVFVNVEDMR